MNDLRDLSWIEEKLLREELYAELEAERRAAESEEDEGQVHEIGADEPLFGLEGIDYQRED